MDDRSPKNSKDLRRQHNAELIRRMRNGETLTSFDSKSSWFPPRPTIEKDKAEIERLYASHKPKASQPAAKDVTESGNVVQLGGARQNLGEAS